MKVVLCIIGYSSSIFGLYSDTGHVLPKLRWPNLSPNTAVYPLEEWNSPFTSKWRTTDLKDNGQYCVSDAACIVLHVSSNLIFTRSHKINIVVPCSWKIRFKEVKQREEEGNPCEEMGNHCTEIHCSTWCKVLEQGPPISGTCTMAPLVCVVLMACKYHPCVLKSPNSLSGEHYR